MKTLILKAHLSAALVLSLLAATGAHAQGPGLLSPGGMNSAMLKVFGDTKAFTAKAEVQVMDKAQKEQMSLPMDFALLDNKVRVEMDLAQMKNAQMPANAMDSLKQMGIAHVVTFVRPDQQTIFVTYPNRKCLLKMPMSKEDAEASKSTAKVDKTALGKETLDGHPCVKNKVVVTTDKGEKVEMVTWNATDLKDFPIQIQTPEPDKTAYMKYKQVQLTKPDAKLFEVPAGYTEYSSQQELFMALMKNAAGGEKK